jgi:hypothetical protein
MPAHALSENCQPVDPFCGSYPTIPNWTFQISSQDAKCWTDSFGGEVKASLIRSAIAALLVTPAASLAFYFFLTAGASARPERSPILPLVVATFLGATVGAAGAVVTFLFSRFPHSAKVGAIFASGLCLVLSAISVSEDLYNGKAVELQSILMWLILWPLGFAASLWFDVRRAVARAILDAVAKK